ncbi:Rieske 2Fe-2S domain-containing protein [Gordonia mangrovi]|nr:Rieske 2Fe-2S domain-containing protein [Gordonia mangrovi]UVF76632.1 Rieske (2Fe-2S) protein [Gordonia mangrovi]
MKPVPNQSPTPTTDITGWFQVLWSEELAVGEVKPMHYFDEELVAWRDNDGVVHIQNAFCQHLGAHLGHGGTVTEDNCIQCPFHGWRWDANGRNKLIPYQANRPNKVRRIETKHVREQNECIFMWNDALGRDPLFDIPDVFDGLFDDEATADQYYRAYPEGTMIRSEVSLHPQWVMENGVDFAHFQYVHKAGSLPELVGRDFRAYDSVFEVSMTFGEGKAPTALTPNGAIKGGTNSRSIGLGIGSALFWGADTMRTIVCVTPVDSTRSTLRSTVWLPKRDLADGPVVPEKLQKRMDMANLQVERDLQIWENQIYLDPPALAAMETAGYRELRQWSKRFYPLDHPEEAQKAAEQATAERETRVLGERETSVLIPT